MFAELDAPALKPLPAYLPVHPSAVGAGWQGLPRRPGEALLLGIPPDFLSHYVPTEPFAFHSISDWLRTRFDERFHSKCHIIERLCDRWYMLIGYMRYQKADLSQATDLQRDALNAAGVESAHCYEDRASGKREDRPGLTSCLKALRPGDTLVVWKLDRLGRDLRHLINTVHDLTGRGID
jgi:hypothetical protein